MKRSVKLDSLNFIIHFLQTGVQIPQEPRHPVQLRRGRRAAAEGQQQQRRQWRQPLLPAAGGGGGGDDREAPEQAEERPGVLGAALRKVRNAHCQNYSSGFLKLIRLV